MEGGWAGRWCGPCGSRITGLIIVKMHYQEPERWGDRQHGGEQNNKKCSSMYM